mmetsp:Transcript_76377/g.202825  ORF Transcript_76377/g.202825 Transcript_76377/m.202825 type:complete len:519 (-) Transcript_76377:24-1580(-)
MTTVDFCPPALSAPSSEPGPAAAAAEFSCAACSETFASAAELRAHCKSERHVYNTKRRLNGLKPISLEAWERKLREARGADAAHSKGTSHLKEKEKKKPPRKDTGDAAGDGASEATAATSKEEEPWTPECCLFDRRRFASIDENLSYMWKTYNFSVPDKEYCTDLPGLLTFLWKKISEPPHACIFCHRPFPDLASVRRHMVDKAHTRIGTEARSRRGNISEFGTEEMRSELEDFYDFHGSTKEITERIKDPKQKVGALLRYFDADRDGLLNREELGRLWAAMSDEELSDAQYAGACGKAGAEPEKGLEEEALATLYKEGLADLDAHFAVLQELLAKKVLGRRGKEQSEEAEDADKVDKKDEDEGEEDDGEDDEDDGGSSSGTEIVECEDEDEFAEVLRILGMEPATLNENGDLRLPNGSTAANRDVAHIWRQRGQRADQLTVSSGRGKVVRAPLMLSNNAANTGQALTKRQEARQGKKIIAVLKQHNKYELRLGLNRNVLQTQKRPARTGFGDASGGR